TNSQIPFQVLGNGVEGIYLSKNISIYGNTMNFINDRMLVYSDVLNVSFYSNNVVDLSNGGLDGNRRTTIHKYTSNCPYILVETNNDYWTLYYNQTGQTNTYSYGSGSRIQVVYGLAPGAALALGTADAALIPAGAAILIPTLV